MEFVYELEHVYEIDGEEEVKSIGIFSSREKAKEAIRMLKSKPGFKDHSLEAFQIHKSKIDQIDWVDGFCSWQEALDAIPDD